MAFISIICFFLAFQFRLTFTLNNGLSITPPRGWLAWERYACIMDCDQYPDDCISEKLFKAQADRLAADGYLDAGYQYVMIDDCWMLRDRDPITHKLVADPKRFPSGIRALADYVHSKGLKLGIYLDFGTLTCGGYAGSLFYMKLDAQTIAEWGIDSLKLDGCNSNPGDHPEGYAVMEAYMNETGRPIYFSCSYPAYADKSKLDVGRLQQSCNSWRIFDDIDDSYDSIKSIINWFGNDQYKQSSWAGPNHWNDADMLLLGDYGLSYEQQRLQMAVWALLGSPLLISSDLRKMPPQSKALLLNSRVLTISADPLGIAGRRIVNISQGDIQVFTRPLSQPVAGSLAFAIVYTNTFGPPQRVNFRLVDLGLIDNRGYNVTDVFSGTLVGTYMPRDTLSTFVAPSGVQLFLATPGKQALDKHKSKRHVVGLLHSQEAFPQFAGLDPPASIDRASSPLARQLRWPQFQSRGLRASNLRSKPTL